VRARTRTCRCVVAYEYVAMPTSLHRRAPHVTALGKAAAHQVRVGPRDLRVVAATVLVDVLTPALFVFPLVEPQLYGVAVIRVRCDPDVFANVIPILTAITLEHTWYNNTRRTCGQSHIDPRAAGRCRRACCPTICSACSSQAPARTYWADARAHRLVIGTRCAWL
jgi:hypothetical protein